MSMWGHQGLDRTLARLREAYRWPKMRKQVFQVVNECGTCALHQPRKTFSPMKHMPVPSMPNELVAIDLIGPLPHTPSGNKYAIVTVDHCSGWAEVVPIPDKRSLWVIKYLERDFFPRKLFAHCAPV